MAVVDVEEQNTDVGEHEDTHSHIVGNNLVRYHGNTLCPVRMSNLMLLTCTCGQISRVVLALLQ